MTQADKKEPPLLDGLTVLDLSQGIAGPYCGLLLRQQGARVIKVEPPTGDWSRQMGRARDGHTAISIAYNAGKESVVLDTRTPEGRAALQRLAAQADIVIQNFRPGVAERMGAGYEALARDNPKLIYVSISGYGPEGPMAQLPALDTTMQAVSGLMHVNRDAATGQPRRIGFFLIDLTTGMYAAQSVGTALYRAALTGQGRHIQVSMLQASAALQSYIVLDDAMFPNAESSVFNAPTGIFETQDGPLYISMLNDAMFQRLAATLGFDDWLTDPGLRSSAGRMPRAAELNKRVAAALAGNTLEYWENALADNDVLFGRVNHPRALCNNPQALHSGLFSPLQQTGIGELPLPGLPGNGSHQEAPGEAPYLGQHTEAILKEFSL
ncbi:MAG: CoA transferase [Alcaligenaceae bacterium]|nr:CoA transferase [Alcaligenaceae bacterium]